MEDDRIWEFLGTTDQKIRDAVLELAKALVLRLGEAVSKCESPIEMLLGIYLVAALVGSFPRITMIVSQKELETQHGTYRVDFWMTFADGKGPSLAIECDGHDFHERTKEQAARDRQRDRHLLEAGHHVLHFTGSEIWKDPQGCASEALRHFRGLCQESQT
ncbi:MAG TPA: DUF559 domain-containing protein [Bacillota bacterium]